MEAKNKKKMDLTEKYNILYMFHQIWQNKLKFQQTLLLNVTQKAYLPFCVFHTSRLLYHVVAPYVSNEEKIMEVNILRQIRISRTNI